MIFAPFAKLETAPPDPILGLTDAFRADPNPDKINLGVGVYLNDDGANTVLKAVKQAEKILLEEETTKNYLPIQGEPAFGKLTQTMLFGEGHPVLVQGRAASLQTPGGTGALRLGGDFLKVHFPGAVVWISDPTWPNHRGVFQAAGLKVATYPYYDPATSALRLDEILAAMGAMARGDVVVLHACCHNPTGIDPTPAQWDQLIRAMEQRGLIPFVDFAYQGFGSDVDGDAYVVRALGKSGLSFLVAGSFSKNFGLYRERTGVLTVTAGDKPEMERVMSQVKAVARANYSNPPAHGGKVVELILSRPDLKKIWSAELDEMRDRIKQMRILFGETLKAKGVNQDFSFLTRQNGMFSFSGITKEQVGRLKSEFGVYLVDNGRINVAGMTTKNMDRLCGAIAKVL